MNLGDQEGSHLGDINSSSDTYLVNILLLVCGSLKL